MQIYLASPMAQTAHLDSYSFSEDKLKRNLEVKNALERVGFQIYLPQQSKQEGKLLLDEHLNIIKKCDCLVILLSDTRGIYIEAGYAKALGKKVYAIKVAETRKLSGWLEHFFDYVAEDVDSLVLFMKH